MPQLGEEGRRLQATVAAHEMHARNDSAAIVEKMNEGRLAGYERLVDPEGKLPPRERERRAKQAWKADQARRKFEAHKARLAAGGVL